MEGWQAALDVDGDGVYEIVCGAIGYYPSSPGGIAYQSLLGSGDWIASPVIPSSRVPTTSASIEYTIPVTGDLDGDGLDDIVTSRYVRGSPVPGNNGPDVPSIWVRNAQRQLEERFQLTTMRVAVQSGVTMDFDNDGDLDLFLCTSAGARTYVNQGGAMFTDVTAANVVQPPGYEGGPCVLVDVDLDGDLDVFATSAYQYRIGPTYVFENLGAGQFVARDQFLYVWSSSVSAVDVNGDGNRDVVMAYPVTPSVCPVRAFLASPGSTSMPSGDSLLPTVQGQARKTSAFDFDEDGDEDLFVAGDQHALWENANGRLVPASAIVTPTPGTVTVRTKIDFDRDGDVDVITGVFGGLGSGSITVMSNQLRDARMKRAPTRGGRFDVAFTARAGHAMVTMLSTGSARADLPGIGLVLLDPLQGVFGPTLGYPFACEATASFAIPDLPALAGVQLHVQGLDVDLARGTAQTTARVRATVP